MINPSTTSQNPHFDNVTDSLSSVKLEANKKHVTREEAMLGLKVKQAELLDTGEIRLGNGKIIGTRELKYIYKQKFRLPDKREAVIVNKLSLEYRRLNALTNGDEAELFKGRVDKAVLGQQFRGQQALVGQKLRIAMNKGKTWHRPA